ncbi:hypothetical protein chiPu_0004728 [Chiloscyllium punctatum]|uniref:Uncharacterized protein n=1 Tax=Chiloscyllium punctatum TaxID=137246 RepID=A0A401S7E0_CHIPU|nr:hypothetical protein [Chiloscyllium punctatum]
MEVKLSGRSQESFGAWPFKAFLQLRSWCLNYNSEISTPMISGSKTCYQPLNPVLHNNRFASRLNCEVGLRALWHLSPSSSTKNSEEM